MFLQVCPFRPRALTKHNHTLLLALVALFVAVRRARGGSRGIEAPESVNTLGMQDNPLFRGRPVETGASAFVENAALGSGPPNLYSLPRQPACPDVAGYYGAENLYAEAAGSYTGLATGHATHKGAYDEAAYAEPAGSYTGLAAGHAMHEGAYEEAAYVEAAGSYTGLAAGHATHDDVYGMSGVGAYSGVADGHATYSGAHYATPLGAVIHNNGYEEATAGSYTYAVPLADPYAGLAGGHATHGDYSDAYCDFGNGGYYAVVSDRPAARTPRSELGRPQELEYGTAASAGAVTLSAALPMRHEPGDSWL